MNDLAEKALHGLDVARREVWARPMLTFGVLGFVVAAVVVVAGGQVAAARPARPLTGWLGLQDPHGTRSGNWVPGVILAAAIVALVLLWFFVAEFARRHAPRESRVWWVAAAWAAPFAIGPPLLDTTAYRYAAYGLLQRHGHSPYDFGANRLGTVPVVTAIDPAARGTRSGSGPLGTVVQHLAASVGAGSALGAVIVLRVLAVLVAVVLGRVAADLARTRRSRALALTILNPLVLLYVVSAVHLDGLMIALVLAAIGAANQRRWLLSIVLVCIAGSVTGEAFVVLPAIVGAHWLGRRGVAAWQLFGRDILVAAATTAVIGFVVPDGFGWLHTVDDQFSAHTPFSAAGAIAKLLSPVVRGASYDDLHDGARITTITALVCVLVYLLVTVRQRALDRTAGYSLLALALLAPVLYPWYLLWGTLCLVPTAAGVRRIGIFALCAGSAVLALPGFSSLTSNVLTGVLLGVVVLGSAAVVAAPRRERVPAEPVSAES